MVPCGPIRELAKLTGRPEHTNSHISQTLYMIYNPNPARIIVFPRAVAKTNIEEDEESRLY